MFLLKKRLTLLDTIGTTASLLCAVHCALHPLLMVLLPVTGLSFLISSGFETVFLGASALLALWALASGWRYYGRGFTFGLWLVGVCLIFSSRLWEHQEVSLSVLGALSLSGTHLLNQYYLRTRSGADEKL